MKTTKTIAVTLLILGASSLANAASVFQTTTINLAAPDSLDIVFDWNGTASNGQETLDISSLLPTWNIQVKTNPQPPDTTKGIFVLPNHASNPDSAGRTHYFSSGGTPLNWTVPHPTTGPGHYDSFTLTYLSVTTDNGGVVTGARLRLEGNHITAAPVPLPAAVWLFGTGLMMLAGLGKWRREKSVHDPSG